MVYQYKNNGYNMVLDVESGSVHVVDDLSYDVIGLYAGHSLEEIKKELPGYEDSEIEEVYEEIKSLESQGALFTEDEYEDYITEFKGRPTVVKALCLHIAHDCNLACKYCFAEEGEYHGDRSMMSFEVGKQALDFLVENSGNRRNLEVDFFGGEPLMNFEVVKQLVAYGRSLEEDHNKKFRFTLTTNGVLLDDEVMEFANQEMANVVLSIDGRKEVHDTMRPTRNGKGSYDLIIDKFKKFAKLRDGKSYYVRGTFTHDNLDFSKDVLHLADEGFDQISVEPVVGPEEERYTIKEADLPKIMEEYDLLAKEIIKREKEGRGFTFFHFMIDLTGGPCVAKRLSGCGSGTEYLAVTPWGDLYPCHQFVGEDEFAVGNVFDGVTRQDIVSEFKKTSVYSKEDCRECFARFYCSGGCSANSHKLNGTINGTYDVGCKLERKRVECALMVKAALADQSEEV
ncbi:thioether cross-link-forming SCIFF peptide maturase [Anaerostipes sp.]|uniref:thioether cross-link-forming SCIFF peptide maturase n=1 Tax=Anaerostipes sp. TaxID=1872530 RepID=UPI0025C145F3|nr:thioether cross-link-forming SCIFF peptide maturase [Anaerostipes sp.]MBS7007562.1 thioether cross-link-forming SCIFF peptide maturase [Anaerostipes sp.]